jgi:hypothetical protein
MTSLQKKINASSKFSEEKSSHEDCITAIKRLRKVLNYIPLNAKKLRLFLIDLIDFVQNPKVKITDVKSLLPLLDPEPISEKPCKNCIETTGVNLHCKNCAHYIRTYLRTKAIVDVFCELNQNDKYTLTDFIKNMWFSE